MDRGQIIGTAKRYLLATGLMAASVIMRSLFFPVLHAAPYIAFFPPITVAALYGGLGPGILAIALSVLVVSRFFDTGISAVYTIPGGLAGMLLFLASGVIVLAVCVLLRNAKQHISEEAGRLLKSEQSLQAELTERKRMEEEQERLLADLARSNRELEQFAYVASHDLQEPLRMVGSYMQLLERKYKGKLDEQADEYISFAVDGAVRMQKLIEGLLAYSRIARGRRELRLVDANKAFTEAVSNLSAATEESHATVTKDDLPTISGDETQLVQLFQNLIGNAMKFRKPAIAPLVHIAAEKRGREWVFCVRDNGIGISPEYYDRVFLIFQRLHSRAQYPGTGIGLALCKRIVERHRGRIWIESVPGEGTSFFFTIPCGGGK